MSNSRFGRRALDREKLRGFLREDVGHGDITSEALVDDRLRARARIIFREGGVAAGLEEAAVIFDILNCEAKLRISDGDKVAPGTTAIDITGLARGILAGERTALNLIGRMSGIATAFAEAVSRASRANTRVRVAATRKTAPGLRDLDKRAVELGGGDTHRFGMDDCVLIKDNHLKLGLSIAEAVTRARQRASFTKKIEIEVESLEQALEAAGAGADIIMFDNMPPPEIARCLMTLKEQGLREGRLFEASGNITLENVEDYAASGADILSIGSLTHSIRILNVKLEIEPVSGATRV